MLLKWIAVLTCSSHWEVLFLCLVLCSLSVCLCLFECVCVCVCALICPICLLALTPLYPHHSLSPPPSLSLSASSVLPSFLVSFSLVTAFGSLSSSALSFSLSGPCSFVYETEHFSGVAELLEILGRWVLTSSIRSCLAVSVSVFGRPVFSSHFKRLSAPNHLPPLPLSTSVDFQTDTLVRRYIKVHCWYLAGFCQSVLSSWSPARLQRASLQESEPQEG